MVQNIKNIKMFIVEKVDDVIAGFTFAFSFRVRWKDETTVKRHPKIA